MACEGGGNGSFVEANISIYVFYVIARRLLNCNFDARSQDAMNEIFSQCPSSCLCCGIVRNGVRLSKAQPNVFSTSTFITSCIAIPRSIHIFLLVLPSILPFLKRYACCSIQFRHTIFSKQSSIFQSSFSLVSPPYKHLVTPLCLAPL